MVRYYNAMVVFEEIPDEITLAINITNCPCHCIGCHSMFLWGDAGIDLDFQELQNLIDINTGITCVAFMGGDANPKEINDLAVKMKNSEKLSELKVAWYSGRDVISEDIDKKMFDFIKIGHYDENFGGLDKETTNQRLYKVEKNGKELIDITERFWMKKKTL